MPDRAAVYTAFPSGQHPDPSGGVVVGASLTAGNNATGQERTATTDASGVYNFSLLPPGQYSVKFGASGFKTSTVGSVTVNVTETAVLNQKLEVGAQTAEVTVESTAETVTPCIGGTPNPTGNAAAPCGAFPSLFFPPGPPFFGEGSLFPGAGTGFGNSGVGIIMGPGQHNWDMSFMKHTKITEGLDTEFRAEFYNIWNHPQFNPPANDFGTLSTFGTITSSSVPPRIVQFALKFIF